MLFGWMEKEWDITGFAGCEVDLWFIVGSYDSSSKFSQPWAKAKFDTINFLPIPFWQCADPVFVDVYTPQTSGWGYDHFNNIKEGVLHCCPNGLVNVLPGLYKDLNIPINI